MVYLHSIQSEGKQRSVGALVAQSTNSRSSITDYYVYDADTMGTGTFWCEQRVPIPQKQVLGKASSHS